jgi:hypothetical protein
LPDRGPILSRAAPRASSPKALAALVPDPALRRWLHRYYRAQSVVDPQTHHHGVVARAFGGRLLADAAADLAPDACDIPLADDAIA